MMALGHWNLTQFWYFYWILINFVKLQIALQSFQEVINRLCHGTQGDHDQYQESNQSISEVHCIYMLILLLTII